MSIDGSFASANGQRTYEKVCLTDMYAHLSAHLSHINKVMISHCRRRMAIDWDNNLIDSLFCKYTFWNPTYRYNRLENCCFGFDRLVHCEVTSVTNLLQRSIMAYRSLVWTVIRSVMIVEIFEQKHRSEHKKKCPRIDKFYRCLLLHLFPICGM